MKALKFSLFCLVLMAFSLATKPVPKVNYEELESVCRKNNDTLYIVNYWATWCRPCVGEMPYFFESAKKFKAQKVKIIFASINSVKETDKVEKFVVAKKIEQDVFILSAGNPNVWIDKVDPSWGGSIPATIMYKKKEKLFFREGEFTQTELDSIINLKIK